MFRWQIITDTKILGRKFARTKNTWTKTKVGKIWWGRSADTCQESETMEVIIDTEIGHRFAQAKSCQRRVMGGNMRTKICIDKSLCKHFYLDEDLRSASLANILQLLRLLIEDSWGQRKRAWKKQKKWIKRSWTRNPTVCQTTLNSCKALFCKNSTIKLKFSKNKI